MAERLILLPGWGLGVAALKPLATALQQHAPSLDVSLVELPERHSANPEDWLDDLDARLPPDTWLGGWSLGGMLATALAARRGTACRGLLTLAANARFVAQADWPSAMPADTFAAFQQGCAEDSAATLKRFALLCAQGCAEARALSRQLQQGIPDQASAQRLAGLSVLAALDNRQALGTISIPQTHLLASHDALLPSRAASALSALLPTRATVRLLEQTGHAALLDCPEVIATLWLECLQGVRHD